MQTASCPKFLPDDKTKQKPKHNFDHEIRSGFGAQWRVHHALKFYPTRTGKADSPGVAVFDDLRHSGGTWTVPPNKKLSDPPPLLLAPQNPSVSWSYVEIVVQGRLITKETTLPARVDINLGSSFSWSHRRRKPSTIRTDPKLDTISQHSMYYVAM